MNTPEPEAGPTLAARLVALKRTPASVAIVVACVGAYAFTAWKGDPDDALSLLRFGASERSHLWRGELFRLVTPMFLHGGLLHLGANMLFGSTWNLAVERTLGTRRFALLYLLSGVFGTATSVLLHDAVSVGASGAMFGMVGVVLALHYRAAGSAARFVRHPAVRSLVFSVGMWVAIGFQMKGIDNWAHLGGLFYGGVLAYVLTANLRPHDAVDPAPPPEPGAHRIHWAMALTVLAFAVAAAGRRWPTQRSKVGAFEALQEAYPAIEGRDLPRADALLARAVEYDDSMPEVFTARATVRDLRGDERGAIEDLERALRVAPPGWPPREIVADALAKTRAEASAPSAPVAPAPSASTSGP